MSGSIAVLAARVALANSGMTCGETGRCDRVCTCGLCYRGHVKLTRLVFTWLLTHTCGNAVKGSRSFVRRHHRLEGTPTRALHRHDGRGRLRRTLAQILTRLLRHLRHGSSYPSSL